mgnify:CR=1 FL=1
MFSALSHRNFRLFWGGQTLSLVGTWMQSVAQGWLALELSERALVIAEEHGWTSQSMTTGAFAMAGMALVRMGRFAEAERGGQQADDGSEAGHGDGHEAHARGVQDGRHTVHARGKAGGLVVRQFLAQRQRPTCSFRKTIDRIVVKGTPSCPITAATPAGSMGPVDQEPSSAAASRLRPSVRTVSSQPRGRRGNVLSASVTGAPRGRLSGPTRSTQMLGRLLELVRAHRARVGQRHAQVRHVVHRGPRAVRPAGRPAEPRRPARTQDPDRRVADQGDGA